MVNRASWYQWDSLKYLKYLVNFNRQFHPGRYHGRDITFCAYVESTVVLKYRPFFKQLVFPVTRLRKNKNERRVRLHAGYWAAALHRAAALHAVARDIRPRLGHGSTHGYGSAGHQAAARETGDTTRQTATVRCRVPGRGSISGCGSLLRPGSISGHNFRCRAAARDTGPRLGHGSTHSYGSLLGTGPRLYTGLHLHTGPRLEIPGSTPEHVGAGVDSYD